MADEMTVDGPFGGGTFELANSRGEHVAMVTTPEAESLLRALAEKLGYRLTIGE